MPLFMGIDVGSGTSKGVIVADGKVVAQHLLPSGFNYKTVIEKLREELLIRSCSLPRDIAGTVLTGNSAGISTFSSKQVTDMRCCARGIGSIFPLVRTVIDVQRQSSKVIRLNDKGQVIDSVVSERCAAGSLLFLDAIVNVLQMRVEDVGALSLKSKNPVSFSTGCAVFGESEAVSRVAEGIAKEDILAGVHVTLANRISTLVALVGLETECAISGGGGLDIGLIKTLEDKLGVHLHVPSQPQLINALGAAIIAQEETGL